MKLTKDEMFLYEIGNVNNNVKYFTIRCVIIRIKIDNIDIFYSCHYFKMS